ncbi:MAG: aminopeptidase P N-terminal domain-containing protein [Candidatus Saccharimonadales bacterium]
MLRWSRNADTTYPFRQDSNILYLSGITLPNIALYIDTKTGNSYLVLPRHTKVEIMFDDVHEYEYAATAAGLNGCITQTELLVRLQKLSKKARSYLISQHVHVAMDNTLTRIVVIGSIGLQRQVLCL